MALLLVAGVLAFPQAGHAIDLVDISKSPPMRDLSVASDPVDAADRSVQVELPGAATGVRTAIKLDAQGAGPRFRWIVSALTNSSAEPRAAVISIPDQGFAGSGFVPLNPAGPRVFSLAVAGNGTVEALAVPGETAYAVTIPPGGTAALAFEMIGPAPAAITLWQREAYDGRKDYLSFFRGALLGVSVLLSVALFALYGFRARGVFPVAGAFGLSAVAFMMLEAGHLPAFLAQLQLAGVGLQVMRGVTEGMMAALLLLLLHALSGLQRGGHVMGMLLLALGALAFVLPGYAFIDPLTATQVARAVFAATAVLGFILILVLWWRQEVDAGTAVLSWSAILVWTAIAVAAALSPDPTPLLPAVLLAGLGAVLVVIGFALAHHAFSQGYLSRHFFREAGRHALALAGARSYVWDWQPEEGELFVSPEMARALAQPPEFFEGAGSEAFLEIMHPADRSAYLATVEEAAEDGRMPIRRQFRLRDGEGGYRWFELRARSITGHGLRAARCIGTMVDVTDAKLAEERLLDDAVYDLVTGLPNRALFMDRLERALEAWDPDSSPGLFVMIVDLDRFKLVNDGLGHEAGDALLAVVGRRLRSETGLLDSIARLPGDKFAILFHEVPGGRDVARFADELMKAVARPITLHEEDFIITASIGIAQYRGEEIAAEKLMKNAAIALYEARRRGTRAMELFNPAMVDERADLVILEAELRRALERNEIEVHYQPIARLADMHLAGFEALVRWRHPKFGLLAPESFIALAEETGLIRDIGRIVLNEAGRQLGIWQRAYRTTEPAFVAVNLSSSQLIEPGLLDDVKQIIGREGLARGSFKIEVTESLVMQYPERAAQILERFRELGVGLSCDDFGTGYSSLSSLRRLPFDTLKVDRSFIAPEGQEQRAGVIVASIISMAHQLGLAVVAEGIENQDQVDRLGAIGCDYGQGYFIGKPLSAKQVNDALAGLPYASSSGRTAITWLWERAAKDPPPEPKRRPLTGRAPQPGEEGKMPRASSTPPQAEPARFHRKSAAPPSAETEPPPPPAVEPASLPAEEPPAAARPEAGAMVPVEEAASAPETSEAEAEVAEEPVADAPLEDAAPPPAPRRRKRQRRLPTLDEG